jgi:hypothetical protein
VAIGKVSPTPILQAAHAFSSLRCENFWVLAVPSDLTAHPVSVSVQDSKARDRALMPMLNSSQRLLDLFDKRSLGFRSVIEITLPEIA